MLELTKIQLIAIASFVLVLISIPLGSILVKNSQIFKSSAQEVRRTPNQQNISSKVATNSASKPVPKSSPLSDLNKLLEMGTGTSSPSSVPTSTGVDFGSTLSAKIAIEGRASDNQAAKVFLGIAAGNPQAKPTYLVSFTVDFPKSGVFSGISLAGLNVGTTYTAYLKGPAQIDSSSTFVMGPSETTLNNNQPLTLLSGDLNEDNIINSTDYALAKNSYGATPGSPKWNERADFNLDGLINNLDIAYVTKNYGKTGASEPWYSTPPATPTASGSATATSSGTPVGSPSGGYESSDDASNPSGYWMWVPSF